MRDEREAITPALSRFTEFASKLLQAAGVSGYLTIRPVARKGYGSIAHEAKPNGLLIRGP